MRGFKIVIRQFPHEVADVEPVLSAISQQEPQDFQVHCLLPVLPVLLYSLSLQAKALWDSLWLMVIDCDCRPGRLATC